MWCQEPTGWLTGISDWDADMQEERYRGGNTAAGMFSCHSLLLESVRRSRWHWEVSWEVSWKTSISPLSSSSSTLNPTFDSSLLFFASPHETLRMETNTLRNLSVLQNDFYQRDERRAAQTWNQRLSLIWLADMQSCLWILVTGENREIMPNACQQLQGAKEGMKMAMRMHDPSTVMYV